MAWSARNGNYWQVGVSCWIESQTDKTATVVTQSYFRSNWRISVMSSIRWSMAWNGKSGSWTGEGTGRWIESEGDAVVTLSTARETVNKGAGWTYGCSASCTVSAVSSGTQSVSASCWIPAQTLRPPSAPSGLAAQRTGAGIIGVSWRNNASNATSTSIERCPYGGAWAVVSSPSSVVTSYSDSVGTGTYKYRVRYKNGDGWSGYSNESEWVTALCAPAAPTCVMPASGSTLDANAGRPSLQWRHNPLDTSAQTAAEVKWTFDGWATSSAASVSGAGSTLAIDAEPNTDVQWQVRTKGAYDGDGSAEAAWSPWSGASMFRVRTPPSVTVAVDEIVTNVPVAVSWDYEDAMGTQASAAVAVFDASGARVYLGTVSGAQESLSIPPADFTPVHQAGYTVTVTATSTTSLQSSDSAGFRVEYEPPPRPRASVMEDEEAHAAVVTVYAEAGEVATVGMAVWRDGELLADGLASGERVIDRTPPLDVECAYRVVAYAASGAVSETMRRATVHSRGFAVVNYGEGLAKVAKMRRNLSMPDGIKGERAMRETASAVYPVPFYGPHAERKHTLKGEVWALEDATGDGERAMLSAWAELERHNGAAHLRLPFGASMPVAIDVDHSHSASSANRASVAVDWQEVSA